MHTLWGNTRTQRRAAALERDQEKAVATAVAKALDGEEARRKAAVLEAVTAAQAKQAEAVASAVVAEQARQAGAVANAVAVERGRQAEAVARAVAAEHARQAAGLSIAKSALKVSTFGRPTGTDTVFGGYFFYFDVKLVFHLITFPCH